MTDQANDVTKVRKGYARGVARRGGGKARPTPPATEPAHPLLAIPRRSTPWEARGACGVEELVNWAFCDQGVGSGADISSRAPVAAGGRSTSSFADIVAPGGFGLDSCAKVERIAAVGCAIDVSRVTSTKSFHPVAEAVAAVVETVEDGRLVREFGRQGSRPGGWQIPDRYLAPEQWEIYGVEAMTLSGREGRGGLPLPYCPIIVVASDETVALKRLRYARWWVAVESVWWRLSHRNLGFRLEPMRAPRAPWEET